MTAHSKFIILDIVHFGPESIPYPRNNQFSLHVLLLLTSVLLLLGPHLDAFARDEHFERYYPDYANLDEMKEHYTRGGLGDVKVKKFLNNIMQEELEPIRNRRAAFEKDIPEIYNR